MKTKSMVVAVALAAGLMFGVGTAYADPQPAAAPATTQAQTVKAVEPAAPAPAAPAVEVQAPKKVATPEELEATYHDVWAKVAQSFHTQTKLTDWASWEGKYKGKLKTDADLDEALKALALSLGDKDTVYLSAADIAKNEAATKEAAAKEAALKEALEKFIADAKEQMKAGKKPDLTKMPQPEFGSLGMTLSHQKDGTYAVDYIRYLTPAYVSPLRSGDTIVSINGKTLRELAPVEVNALLTGKTKEEAEIVVQAGGQKVKFNLPYVPSAPDQLSGNLLPNNTLVVHIPDVDPKTVAELKKALVEIGQKTQLKGLIIDARGTSGGTIDGALDLASAFVDIGPFVAKVEGNGRFLKKETITMTPPFGFTLPGDKKALDATKSMFTMGLIVLTDSSTAGPVQAFIGAVKAGRAEIIGTTTYGSLVGTTTMTLPNGGQMVIASTDYVTPEGVNLTLKGTPADTVVPHARGSRADEAMFVAANKMVEQTQAPTLHSHDSDSLDMGSGFLSIVFGSLAIAGVLLFIVFWARHDHLQKQRREEEEARRRAAR